MRAASPNDDPPPPGPGSADPPRESAEQAAPTAPPATKKAAAPSSPTDADEKRAPVDYDGRGDDPTTAGDVLIWVPRVLLSPFYLVSEFVIRKPLGALVTVAEKNHWPSEIVDFFTFGPNREGGFVPTFFFDFGFRPSFGVYFFWDEAFFPENELRARVSTGGLDYWRLSLADRVRVFPDGKVGVRGDYSLRPDRSFWGFGPTSPSDEVRYGAEVIQGAATLDADLWRSSLLDAALGVRHVGFDPDQTAYGDPSVSEALASGRLSEPPDGLVDGYTVAFGAIEAALDSRPRRFPNDLPLASDFLVSSRTGVRLGARGVLATGLERSRRVPTEEPSQLAWVTYGGSLGGFVDAGSERMVGLSVFSDFVDTIVDDSFIPFTELPSLGGDRLMRGFRPRRLVDRSAIAGNFSYEWPIWVFLDGHLNLGVGNVFGPHLENFDFDLLRGSAEIGVGTPTSPDHPFEIIVGVGTDPFRDGFGIDQVRFAIGSPSPLWGGLL